VYKDIEIRQVSGLQILLKYSFEIQLGL